MSEADLKWFDLCFEYKDGPYSAIQLYKAALRREIEKEIELLTIKISNPPTENKPTTWITQRESLINFLSLLDTVEP